MTTQAQPLDVLAALRLESGKTWGELAADFQHADAEAVLSGDAPHFHLLTRPRGASKTSDLAAVSIVVLVTAPVGARCYAVAADADQAALLLDAIRGFVLRMPSLVEHLNLQPWKVTSKANAATLEVVAADAASAFGLRPHFVVVDELSVWPNSRNAKGVWEAIVSAMPKVPGSRLVVLTTAGDPAHWSHKVLTKAKASPAWRVHEVAGPTPWIAAEALEEQKRLLTESQYARLHLNQWTAAEDRLVHPEDLTECVTLDGPQEPRAGVRYVVGVDVGLRHDRTAIAVCHREADGRVVLDRLIVLSGSRRSEVRLSDVEAAIVEVHEAYRRPRILIDPWQAIGLKQRLQARGCNVSEFPFTAQSVGRLASTLHLLLRDRLLALPDDEALLDELANVRLRETSPGVLRIDHDPGQHDDRAIALALAATALIEKPVAKASSPQLPTQRIVESYGESGSDGRSWGAAPRSADAPSYQGVPQSPAVITPPTEEGGW